MTFLFNRESFESFFSDICPFCGADNGVSLFESIFFDSPKEEKKPTKEKPFDQYDWDNCDNCSDKEYVDDDDYDDFDH